MSELKPLVIPHEPLTPEMNLMGYSIRELSSQLGKLRLHQMGVGTKKNQPLDDKANVLCTNCHRQKNMKSDCPSPQALSPKCRYSSGDHDISSCSRMINEGHPNYNSNIYNNGGYSNNPSRYISEPPMRYNQN